MGVKSAAILFATGAVAITAHAQWPFASPSPGGSPRLFFALQTTSDEPPRDVPLVEKKWDQLPDKFVNAEGQTALAINPDKWRHAETANFILHYRRVTEAQKVAREIEYDIWFVAKALGATKERYRRKSHVFVFEDEEEWKEFLGKTSEPPWFASFAFGDELFLNVRRTEVSGQFDSHLLAHETTHAVVARLYPRARWPLWLSEGFAEYMGGASVAARKSQPVKRHERTLDFAKLPLDKLVGIERYPTDPIEVAQLYQSGEKLVRFLNSELPKERFPKFIDTVLAGQTLPDAVLAIYGDTFKDFAAFTKKYERFSK